MLWAAEVNKSPPKHPTQPWPVLLVKQVPPAELGLVGWARWDSEHEVFQKGANPSPMAPSQTYGSLLTACSYILFLMFFVLIHEIIVTFLRSIFLFTPRALQPDGQPDALLFRSSHCLLQSEAMQLVFSFQSCQFQAVRLWHTPGVFE